MGRRRALSALLTQHDLVVAATVEDADDRDGIVENGERDNESPRVSDRPLSPIVRRPGRPDVVTRGAAVRERRKFGNAAGPSQKVTIAWVKWAALSGNQFHRCGRTIFQLRQCLASIHKPAGGHRPASCLTASCARTSLAVTTSFGSATSAS